MLLWDQTLKERTLVTAVTAAVVFATTTDGPCVVVAAMVALFAHAYFAHPLTRIVLVGPACAGKDYLRDALERKGAAIDVSVTTRAARDGEIPGRAYHFVSPEEMAAHVERGELYEHVRFGDKEYGTLLSSWETSDVFIMSPDGVTQNIRAADRPWCYVVYLDPPEDVLAARWEEREASAQERSRRMATDQIKFAGFRDYDVRITDPAWDADELADLLLHKIHVW